jgi:hypothetical protein
MSSIRNVSIRFEDFSCGIENVVVVGVIPNPIKSLFTFIELLSCC